MLVPINEGARGPWRIEQFEISRTQADFENLRHMMRGRHELLVAPGTYTRLVHAQRGVVMSNTPMEVRTHAAFVRRATGRLLITGLGLGMVLRAVLDKPEVTHVTVIEIDPDIIALVAPRFAAETATGRLEIRCADAFAYRPGRDERYDGAWHDVWDTIGSDNIKEMGRLTRKWARRTEWQMCWARSLCERLRR